MTVAPMLLGMKREIVEVSDDQPSAGCAIAGCAIVWQSLRMYQRHRMPAGLTNLEAWSFRGSGQPHRVLPDGCIDFLFDLHSGRMRIVGPMTRAEIVQVEVGQVVFGVRFRPGSAALFVDACASELVNRDIGAEHVLGQGVRPLADAVCGASTHDERTQLIAAFATNPNARRRAVDARVRRAAALIERAAGAVPIREVALAVGIGERQLERLFQERIGLRPKLLARIMRIQHSVRALEAHRGRQLDLAIACGYADEAHLVREFQAVCGVSPSRLRRERDVGFVQAE
jgi:AraC-like DNA-binding protein